MEKNNTNSEFLKKFNNALNVYSAQYSFMDCVMKFDDCRHLKFEHDVDAPQQFAAQLEEIENMKKSNTNARTIEKKLIMLSAKSEEKWVMCFLSKDKCVQRYGSLLQNIIKWIDKFLTKFDKMEINWKNDKKNQLEMLRNKLVELREKFLMTQSLSERFKLYYEIKMNLFDLSKVKKMPHE